MFAMRRKNRSESESRYKLHRARVAREEPDVGCPLVVRPEGAAARDQEVAADGVGKEWRHVIEKAADELRVVEQVEGLGADVEAEPFCEIDALGQSHIEVVCVIQRESVASAVREGALTGYDITGVGFVGDVGDDVVAGADLPGRIVPGDAAAQVGLMMARSSASPFRFESTPLCTVAYSGDWKVYVPLIFQLPMTFFINQFWFWKGLKS